MLQIGQAHLTQGDKRAAIAGQASWAGEGPTATTCRGCEHWDFQGYFAANRTLKPSPCLKARALMNNSHTPKIEYSAPSCKFYKQTIQERPIEKPDSRQKISTEKSQASPE